MDLVGLNIPQLRQLFGDAIFILKWQDNVLMIGEQLWFGSFCMEST